VHGTADMCGLTTVGSSDRLDVLRPPPCWLGSRSADDAIPDVHEFYTTFVSYWSNRILGDDQLSSRKAMWMSVSDYVFRRGQHVMVEINGEQVDGVFVREAERHDRISFEAVPGVDTSAVGWVRRLDTGEIESFRYADIEPKPDADVRIVIGKAHAARQGERETVKASAEELRVTLVISVDQETTERRAGRRTLGPLKWIAIFLSTTVAASLIINLTNDLYAKVKHLLLDR
jgi:hypothetical protein